MNYGNDDWMATSVAWKNSPCPSPSQEKYGDYEQPDVHSYHMSHASLPAEDSNFKPGGILTVDVDPQYPFHSEPSSTALRFQGSLPVGHPSPTPHHHVSARITSCPMASGTPFGASIAPPSFCVTPPHIPVWSPAPFSYSPYDHRLAMSSVSPERLDIQPVSVSGVSAGKKNYVQSSYTFPTLRQGRLSDVPPIVHPSRPPLRNWLCPRCREPFRRPQDRNRHLLSHLPYWVACSYGGCSWRGYRLDAFRKHRDSEHRSTSQVPDENGSRLYDPGPLVDGIVRGSISIGDAENWAIRRIRNKALSLDNDELFMDPWGRKGKNLKSSRQHSRFAERAKALPITSPTPAFSSAPPAKLCNISPHHALLPELLATPIGAELLTYPADIPAMPRPPRFPERSRGPLN
ncbi:hypothetical protein EDB92DRAFT_417101 [Lactarius akahatsu]|uniref:C2H2-type domain-containing protein n=1 Tax=Lactarius akahatsu TaxID=416441 RepID=A0AAD4LIR5_9AGAM|nr:hypothetical protein EDB92DRAFT_417101 [Lactarius akahatsu]